MKYSNYPVVNKRKSTSSFLSHTSVNSVPSLHTFDSNLSASNCSHLSNNSCTSIPDDHIHKLKLMYTHLFIFIGDASFSLIGDSKSKNTNGLEIQHMLKMTVAKSLTIAQFKIAFKRMIRNESLDDILLRYLRRKNFNVCKSLELFAKFICWRTKLKVDELVAGGDEKFIKDNDDDLLFQYRLGKIFITQGTDKTGKPLVLVRAQRHIANALSAESMERFILRIYEDKRLILKPNSNGVATIFDLTNYTLANHDYSSIKLINQCYKYYPGLIGHFYIYNAPRVFEAVWKVLKVWLDPSLVAKVTFTKDLTKYIDIENLPSDFNGHQPYQYHYIPHIPGENEKMHDKRMIQKLQDKWDDHFKLLHELTILWIQAPEGSDLSYELAKQRIFTLDNLRKTYFELDPYIRGRTVYDRDGTYSYYVPELYQAELEALSNPINGHTICRGFGDINSFKTPIADSFIHSQCECSHHLSTNSANTFNSAHRISGQTPSPVPSVQLPPSPSSTNTHLPVSPTTTPSILPTPSSATLLPNARIPPYKSTVHSDQTSTTSTPQPSPPPSPRATLSSPPSSSPPNIDPPAPPQSKQTETKSRYPNSLVSQAA